jgi:Leucine Rich repeat
MGDDLARKRSLDSLRKEAKRWFEAIRGDAPNARARFERAFPGAPTKPTLRDVQHALALENGFAGWTELKYRLTAAAEQSAKTVAQFDEKATALLEAYRTGTPEAMERHWSLTWHRRNWQGMRTYVQLDLGRQVGAANLNDDITLDDARFLVAREHGFEHWAALLQHYISVPARPSRILMKPIRVRLAGESVDANSIWSSRDWGEVLDRLREGGAEVLETGGQMTDAMLEDIAQIGHLTTLELAGSKQVTDDAVRSLSRMSRLRHLDLSGTALTDRGLEMLRSLPELESLSLAWTRVTDSGISHVSACDRLANLNLQGTACGDAAIGVLAGKSRLCQLRTGDAVTDAGLAFLHDLPSFKQWRGGEAKMGLLNYDASPNYLLLRGTFTDRGMAQLAGLDGLFALNLDTSELRITAAALEPLVDLPHLGWLAFDAKDDAMPHIARMRQLRFLGCQDTVAGDDGFAALSQSQSIEYIWGRRCHNLRTRGLAALANMPALRGLCVSCKNVEDAGVAQLPNFPALRELMPMDVPDEGYRHIGLCEHLNSLILMYCRETSDAATEHIVRLPRLSSYFASYTRITDRTPELLSQIRSLESVTFDGCAGVTNVGLAHLATLPRLRELRVSGQQITPEIEGSFPSRIRVHYSF